MTVGCAEAGIGMSDTDGLLTFSGFASGEIKICLSFVRFGVMGLIKLLFLNVILFDPSGWIWYWRCRKISTTIPVLTQRQYPFKFGSWMATVPEADELRHCTFWQCFRSFELKLFHIGLQI